MTNNSDSRERMREMAEQLKEAVMRLKEAREAPEIKLSDLPKEEWGACKGMWARGKYPNDEVFEGVIFGHYEDDVLVRLPRNDWNHWCRATQLTLLPDYQRAFTSTGDPIKVDPGQWEKTRGMEKEFDRMKNDEGTTSKILGELMGTTGEPHKTWEHLCEWVEDYEPSEPDAWARHLSHGGSNTVIHAGIDEDGDTFVLMVEYENIRLKSASLFEGATAEELADVACVFLNAAIAARRLEKSRES